MARPSRNDCSCPGPNDGLACRTSAAAPATAAAAAEVPKKPELGTQPVDPPNVALLTPSGPAMSGLIRPSIVGPRELKLSSALFCQQTAPTANASGAVAGSHTLPAV